MGLSGVDRSSEAHNAALCGTILILVSNTARAASHVPRSTPRRLLSPHCTSVVLPGKDGRSPTGSVRLA